MEMLWDRADVTVLISLPSHICLTIKGAVAIADIEHRSRSKNKRE